jgi:hypothetical protein
MRVLSALVVLAHCNCRREAFERWVAITLERIEQVAPFLQGDRPACRRALQQILPRCAPELAACVAAAAEALGDSM